MVRANANKRNLNSGNQGRSHTRKVELLEGEINSEEDPNLHFFFLSLFPFMKLFTPTKTHAFVEKFKT